MDVDTSGLSSGKPRVTNSASNSGTAASISAAASVSGSGATAATAETSTSRAAIYNYYKKYYKIVNTHQQAVSNK